MKKLILIMFCFVFIPSLVSAKSITEMKADLKIFEEKNLTSTLSNPQNVIKVNNDISYYASSTIKENINLKEKLKQMKVVNMKMEVEKEERKIYGINFGIGLGFTGTNKKSIKSASVIDGVVRTTKQEKTEAKVMFETHYFFPKKWKSGTIDAGYGPFIAVELSNEDEIIEGYALGFMLGMKTSQGNNISDSWNIGLGYYVDKNVQQFGDGIIEGQALSNGDSIRYKETEANGWILMLSSSF